jgi:hypothetical protein
VLAAQLQIWMDRTGIADPILERMCEQQLPLTKETYVGLCYGMGDLVLWDAEFVSMLPLFFRPRWGWEEQGF